MIQAQNLILRDFCEADREPYLAVRGDDKSKRFLPLRGCLSGTL